MKLDHHSSYYNSIDLMQETAKQIVKDFDMLGYDIRFSDNSENAYNELHEQIRVLVQRLLDNNYQKLLNVLYRIDIDEAILSKAIRENDSPQFPELLTDMIIQRELQKSIIKKYYSKHNDFPSGDSFMLD